MTKGGWRPESPKPPIVPDGAAKRDPFGGARAEVDRGSRDRHGSSVTALTLGQAREPREDERSEQEAKSAVKG